MLPLGPPGAGKSTLKKRLLDEPLQQTSYSTGVADAPLQVAMIGDSREGVPFRSLTQEGAVVPDHQEYSVKWTQQSIDEEAVFLLEHFSKANREDIATSDDEMETTSLSPSYSITLPLPSLPSLNQSLSLQPVQFLLDCPSLSELFQSEDEPQSRTTSAMDEQSPTEQSPTDCPSLSELFQSEDEPQSRTTSAMDEQSPTEQSPTDLSLPHSFTEDISQSKASQTADVLTGIVRHIKKKDLWKYKAKFQKVVGQNKSVPLQVIDTGGQPEFHEMLPALITGPAINLLVFKLTESLNDGYNITYRLPSGNSKPYKTSLTHEEMIFRSLSSIACLTYGTIGWNIGEELVKDKSESAAFLIGTHRDLVDQEKVTTINKDLSDKLKSSDELYGENLVQFHSGDQAIFTLDTINDKDEIEHLQKALNQVIDKRFHEVIVPTSWYVFSMKLRKRKAAVLTKTFCIKIANECGVPKESFMSALWYLHHRVGVLMHFPEVEGLRDIVIIQIQVIFDRITKLITHQFTFSELGHAAASSDFSDRGIFTEETLVKLATRKGDPLTPTRVVSLLQCLHIVAHLNIKGKRKRLEKSYFMPCALRPFILGTASSAHVVSDLCAPPLLVWFECGYTPVGVFCCLVVYLLEITDGPQWSLVGQRHYRNKIKFSVGQNFDEVSLIAYPTYIEVRVERRHHIPEPLGQLCSTILATLDSAIETVIRSLHYSCHSQHLFGSYCSSCPSSCPPHPAVKHYPNSFVLKCVLYDQTCVIPDNSLWFNKVICVYVCVCMYLLSVLFVCICVVSEYVYVLCACTFISLQETPSDSFFDNSLPINVDETLGMYICMCVCTVSVGSLLPVIRY